MADNNTAAGDIDWRSVTLPLLLDPRAKWDPTFPLPLVEPETAAPERVLDEAIRVVYGNRQQNYGHPRVNFKRIADLWSVIVGTTITPEQTGLMMVCLKIARLMETPDHRDSYVDIAGYAAATARAVGLDE